MAVWTNGLYKQCFILNHLSVKVSGFIKYTPEKMTAKQIYDTSKNKTLCCLFVEYWYNYIKSLIYKYHISFKNNITSHQRSNII